MRVTVIAGGVGAARLLAGAQTTVPGADLTSIVNVGDDERICGLSISPDLDTVLYTCSGRTDPDRGWGRAGESWVALDELRSIAAANGSDEIGWFMLGDRDLGVHLWRTERLGQGALLSEVTAELARAGGLRFRLLPATDDPSPTVLETVEAGRVSFQEYFVRHRHSLTVTAVDFPHAAAARPAPGVLSAIDEADIIIIAPSNPLISIAPIRAIPAIEMALRAARDRTVAISGIIGGRALKGPADRLLVELGDAASAKAVAALYHDIAEGFVLDNADAALAPDIEATGMTVGVTDTIMSTSERAAALTRYCCELLAAAA